MKTLLIGINAKYIHPNLAIRLLKKNTKYPVDIKEFNIKDNYLDIVNYIINNNYNIIGFSCYIWNIEFIKLILNDMIFIIEVVWFENKKTNQFIKTLLF